MHSRSPEGADRLAHRRNVLQHSLGGLERTSALLESCGLGEVGCRTGESCATERRSNAGGHGVWDLEVVGMLGWVDAFVCVGSMLAAEHRVTMELELGSLGIRLDGGQLESRKEGRWPERLSRHQAGL